MQDDGVRAPLPQPRPAPPRSPPPPQHSRTGGRRPRAPVEASARRPDQNPYAPRSLPSLRISESGLRAASPPAFTGEDYDEVFFDEPPPPSPPPPPPPLRETDLTEDFPPPPPAEIAPPPPPVWEEEAWHERQDNFRYVGLRLSTPLGAQCLKINRSGICQRKCFEREIYLRLGFEQADIPLSFFYCLCVLSMQLQGPVYPGFREKSGGSAISSRSTHPPFTCPSGLQSYTRARAPGPQQPPAGGPKHCGLRGPRKPGTGVPAAVQEGEVC